MGSLSTDGLKLVGEKEKLFPEGDLLPPCRTRAPRPSQPPAHQHPGSRGMSHHGYAGATLGSRDGLHGLL